MYEDFSMFEEVNYEYDVNMNGGNSNNVNNIEKANIIDKNACTQCNTSDNMITDYTDGCIVCTKCGIVYNNIIDKSDECTQFNDGKNSTSRCSSSQNYRFKNVLGSSIPSGMGNKLNMIHTWNSTMKYSDKTLRIVYDDIGTKCKNGSIIKRIEDDAAILYKSISDVKIKDDHGVYKKIITRGKNRKSLIAACVFFACKRNKDTRSPKEIAKIFGLDDIEITKGCKTFLKYKKMAGLDYELNYSKPEHFIIRFCKKLHLEDYADETLNISRNIQKLLIGSIHTPVSIAAACILLLSDYYDLNITKKMISSMFPVSEVTIYKAYSEISEYKDILFNSNVVSNIVSFMNKIKENTIIPAHLTNRYNAIINNNVNDPLMTYSYITSSIISSYFPVNSSPINIKNLNLNEELLIITYKMYQQIYVTNNAYYDIIKKFHYLLSL